MVTIGSLLDLCRTGDLKNERKIEIFLDEKHFIPMIADYYIVGGTIYFRIPKLIIDVKENDNLTDRKLIDLMEFEAMQDGWGDLYNSPMGQLGQCELKFGYNIMDFDSHKFKIEQVINETNKIIICIKEIKENKVEKALTIEEIIAENLKNLKDGVTNFNYQIETDIEKFADLIRLGKTCKERLQILVMLYYASPTYEEIKKYDIEQVFSYIKETENIDKYRKYYVDCLNAITEILI